MPLSLPHRFALASAAVSSLLFSLPVQAQIVPDGTLGTQVFGACGGTGGGCGVTNGTTRGSNLFHSFLQFSLPNGDLAAFITNPTIQNVIVRVTGVGQPFISNINGTIATTDPTITNIIPTNFFLLNPNGIVFGPNARIFVGGSFLASTAERMLFQDGTVFDTRDQTVNPLLTVSVPVGLQMGQTPGTIQSRLQIGVGINSSFTDFALVGGNVMLDNSVIQAPGRRVELGAVAENSTVGLRLNGDRLRLNLAAGSARRDITLTNGSIVNAAASTGGGEVGVMGRDITLRQGSFIGTGIVPGVGNALETQAGNVTLSASGILQLSEGSRISSLLVLDAQGRTGNVAIQADTILVESASSINTVLAGRGVAGDVKVRAHSIRLDTSGEIVSAIAPSGTGKSGNVDVRTDSLSINTMVRTELSSNDAVGA